MIEIGALQHLFRAFRYQFEPATYDYAISSAQGVAEVGTDPVEFQTGTNPVNSFTISPTLSGILYCSFENTMQVGWLFRMYAGFGPNTNYMNCRCISISSSITYPTQILFEAYESSGSGDYQEWYILSDFLGSGNFVQNTYPSAVASKDRNVVPLGRFNFPTSGTTTTTVTSDTPTSQSGNYTLSYKGMSILLEDQYDYNRPYEGITIEVTRKRLLTVISGTTTYDAGGNPTTVTNINVSSAGNMKHSHTFVPEDFFPLTATTSAGNRIYIPGNAIPYPSPGQCTNEFYLGTTSGGSYNRQYEAYYNPNPPYDIKYRIVYSQTKSYSFDPADGEGTMTIDPGAFFPA